jgi:2-C-methyl-D-erythritol 4-phosphate cytidylyltransferase
MQTTKKNIAIILAGGTGERFDTEKPKQLIKIGGKTILEHTIDKFEKHDLIDEIHVVLNPNCYDIFLELIKKNEYKKICNILYGGKRRQDSSRIGVNSIAEREEVDKVLIHDAVRPFVSNEIITKTINALDSHSAVDVAIPTADTIIKIDDEYFISEIPVRKYLFRGQTPQGFKKEIIVEAHKLAQKDNVDVTDDCSLVLRYNLSRIYVINGEKLNIKITHKHDIYIADRIFQLKKMNFSEIEDSLDRLMDKTIVTFGGTSGIGKQIDILAKEYKAN